MKNLSITLKILIYVSVLGLICIFIMAYVSISAADEILTKSAYDHIRSVQSIKKAQIEDFVKNKENAVIALARMPVTVKAVNSLMEVNDVTSAGTKGTLTQADMTLYSKSFETYMKSNAMANIIIADARQGAIIFMENRAFATETTLAQESNMMSKIWKTCKMTGDVAVSDMERGNGEESIPSLFMGYPIIHQGEILAVLIAEFSSNELNKIMGSVDGLGQTGETYVVGNDFYFRTDSRFSAKSTVLLQKVETKATERAFAGNSGVEVITDYRGKVVLSSYERLYINGLNWAVITEIDEQEIMAPKQRLINTILIVCGIIVVIMVPATILIGRSLSNPINKEVEFAKKLADGQLDATIDIHQSDEIGVLADALRKIAQTTRDVIISVMDATRNLADASAQLSGSSQILSSGASEQASSIEEVSASMEQMSSNIQQNADNANQTEELSNSVSSQVQEGSKIILTTVSSMEQIASKISVISDIAFQTNILALNASVEAARAGEYGRGFGVVASEVGKLADKTKMAAAAINTISNESAEVAEKTKEIMAKLVPSIQSSSLLVQEISAASKEQRDAANQINNAIQILNDVSQQNAAAAEEMATNSEELSSQAEQLVSVISHFKIAGHSARKAKTYDSNRKLITERKSSGFKNTGKNYSKGVDIDLSAPDDLDDEFERF